MIARILLDSMSAAIKDPTKILAHNFLVYQLLGPGDHWHILKLPQITGALNE